MRLAILAISVAALVLSAWAVAAAPTEPKCWPSDTRRHTTVITQGLRSGGPGYARYCGTGKALLQVEGQSITLKGGHCTRERVAFGLLQWNGKLRGRGFWARLEVPTNYEERPGPIPIIDAQVQLPGLRSLPHTGVAVVSRDFKAATFYLEGRSSQQIITGSWTCGAHVRAPRVRVSK